MTSAFRARPAWKVGSRVGGAVWLTLVLLAGSHGCSRQSGLAVGGESPYVRCLAAEAPAKSSLQIGSVRVTREGRSVALSGLRYPVTLAAFSAAGFGPPPGKPELEALRAARPQLVLVLGGIGDSAGIARDTVAALAGLGVPVLILAGARDSAARIEEALSAAKSARERIMDVTTARAVRIANDTLVPVAGAFDGRYALTEDACGYGAEDLDALRSELGAANGARRWLLAWEAPAEPAPYAVARSADGLALGSSALAELADRVGARGGLFAWPADQALRPAAGSGRRRVEVGETAADLELVVPRLNGPALERADGSRVMPGFALLQLDQSGMRLVSTPTVP